MPSAKGAQMEIMGLAIIIILVALGLLFAVLWMGKEPAQQVQRAKESVLAANFLNTMLGTTTECNQRTVRELLSDCALTGGITKCGDQTSCEYARDIINILFDKTLREWKLPFHFAMTGATPVERMEFGTEACKGEREQKIHPMPVKPGFEIRLTMEICR
jgi:hypothetical protein